MTNTTDIKNEAGDLLPGDLFKLPNQRVWRRCIKIVELSGEHVIESHRGKLLIVIEGCKQLILSSLQSVIIQ